MKNLILLEKYQSKLNLIETEVAIKFATELKQKANAFKQTI